MDRRARRSSASWSRTGALQWHAKAKEAAAGRGSALTWLEEDGRAGRREDGGSAREGSGTVTWWGGESGSEVWWTQREAMVESGMEWACAGAGRRAEWMGFGKREN